MRRWSRVAAVIGVAFQAACSKASIQPAVQAPSPVASETPAIESTAEYERAGFLVGDGAVPFVGMVGYFGSESLDTTVVVVALSIPPRALSFVRAGDRYAAYYAVKIDVMSGPTLMRSDRPVGEVRVASYQETTRGDEGVIFQRALRIAPGNYTIHVTAQDSLSAAVGTATSPLSVPIMANDIVAPLFPVFAAEPRASRSAALVTLANPRATVRYGRDSVVMLYIEAYGAGAPDTIVITSRPDGEPDVARRRDTVAIPKTNDPRVARAVIPVARLGLGGVRMTATTLSGARVGSATVMVGIGEQAPVNSVDELLDALRYFASEADLRVLRDATPERRPALWTALMRHTDPNPSTPQNEALHEYLRRVRVANEQYREDARPAWLTDRGAVIVALGEPDIVSEPALTDSTATSRSMTWEYRRLRLLLGFSDQTGLGRWRLTPPSDAEFRSFLAISGPCIGCR